MLPSSCLPCVCVLCRQSLFGRMMNTMEELDIAADKFRKRYLGGTNGAAQATPAGSGAAPVTATNSDAEFVLLDAAYGANSTTSQGGGEELCYRSWEASVKT